MVMAISFCLFPVYTKSVAFLAGSDADFHLLCVLAGYNPRALHASKLLCMVIALSISTWGNHSLVKLSYRLIFN